MIMVTVKDLCDVLEREYYFRMIVHRAINNVSYNMCVKNGKFDEEKFRQIIINDEESNKLYLLQQCMRLISISMIDRGEY